MTLGRTFPEFPLEKVAAASLEALLDPASSDETKTALLQVCGTLGEREALATARAFAGRNSAPVLRASAYPSSLRSSGRRYRGYQTIRFASLASAIAAVGMLGDESDLPLLKRLAASGDVRVSRPAKAAMDRIQKSNQ